MQIKLRNVKTDEVEIVYFPLERPEDFSFYGWEVVDFVRPNEEGFEESDIRCASLIYEIEPERHKELGEYWLDRLIDCGDLKRGTLACQYFDCEKFGRDVEIDGRDGYWRHVYNVWVDYAM